MRYVIIRDDDTNASTPVECLERLYRPALDRGMPVNLATIPEVSLEARNQEGDPEGFLRFKNGHTKSSTHIDARPEREMSSARSSHASRSTCELSLPATATGARDVLGSQNWRISAESGAARERTLAIGANPELTSYLKSNKGYEIVQHGLHHHYLEFDRLQGDQVNAVLARGTELLLDAGFEPPQTFVAPYDKFSAVNLEQVAEHFPIISSGWYELARLPRAWWPRYAWKKLRHAPHWRVGRTLLLTHPGCLLSCFRGQSTSLELIIQHVKSSRLTVLVTHWWEYFRRGTPDEDFIRFLHETIEFLATDPEVKVIRFSDLLGNKIQIN